MTLTHAGTQRIETQRLILRRFESTDVKSVYENWMSDPVVQNNYGEKACDTAEQVQQVLDTWMSMYCSKEFYRWSVVLKETGESIGQIAFYIVDSKNQRVDAEYCIGQAHWGNGYASEALKAVIEYAFVQVNFNRVQAFHRSKNISSGKVLQKAGMKCEGTMKQYLIHKDEFDDCIMYAALRSEWVLRRG
jgi:ribosomal-protein-alanine N-acetyltransferase